MSHFEQTIAPLWRKRVPQLPSSGYITLGLAFGLQTEVLTAISRKCSSFSKMKKTHFTYFTACVLPSKECLVRGSFVLYANPSSRGTKKPQNQGGKKPATETKASCQHAVIGIHKIFGQPMTGRPPAPFPPKQDRKVRTYVKKAYPAAHIHTQKGSYHDPYQLLRSMWSVFAT